ncbi:unnamed protein product [Aureobasidium uvarum]|uniref:SUN domain-containing protein n=1 Tax=Aureobasidium uvarum TaxID=2773716 RepID=A0A9N8KKZ2_9PEZI|nr:unnamed protein product [Aureobasidium uvarum]
MQRAFRNGRALAALLFSLFYLASAQYETNKTSGPIVISNSTINSVISSTQDARNTDLRQTTCRTGTVNYITHSLPQQCLSRSTPTSNSTISLTPTVTPTPSTTNSNPLSSSLAPEEPPSTSTETHSSSSTQPEAEFETDSPLDNANFLSFEEWKNQNLAKVGQSPDHVGQKSNSGQDKPRNPRPIDHALDILGEDSEIELDFGGFGRQDTSSSSTASAQPTVASEQTLRSKDAGKTCKERSNYASFDCAATVLKSNPESKSAHAVLIENKDSYMLNICSSSNKFLIVELCNDILIDTIVLANYEFFSSIFRNFKVSVSDRYPVKADRWRELGVFEARNTRSVQAFLVEQPLIWARYLRIEFFTHYGNEYYCPVSLLRVHGTTMMEEFRHQEELARGEISDDLEESVMPDASPSPAQEPPQEPLQSSKEADQSIAVESVRPIETSREPSAVLAPSDPRSEPSSTSTASTSTDSEVQTSTANSEGISTSTQVHASGIINASSLRNITTPERNDTIQTTTDPSIQTGDLKNTTSTSFRSASSPTNSSAGAVRSSDLIVTSQAHISSSNAVTTHNSSQQMPVDSSSKPVTANPSIHDSANASNQNKSTASSNKQPSASSDVHIQKPGTSTVSSAHSNPTTQESFFKSIHKRLQMLESNATLSLQYIEEQSRILRDAFIKVEKRQIKKTEAFLENLNTTVFAELQDFKQQYDQLWQSTVIELDNHRDQYQREIHAVSVRLSIVADELLFQKRMAIAQMTVMMVCLGLVLFVRTGGGTSLDMPIIQQMVNKSHFGRGAYDSPLNSPSPDQTSPPFTNGDIRRRRGFWRSSFNSPVSRPISRGNGNVSEASVEEHSQSENPDLRFQPPTPTLEASQGTDGEDGVLVSPSMSSSRGEGSFVGEGIEDDEEDLDASSTSLPQETQSSPSTPSGSRDLKALPWPAGGDGSGVISDD